MDCAHNSDWWLLSVSLNCAVPPDFSKAMSRNSVRLDFGSSWLHLSTAAVCPRFASADPSNDCPGWVAVAPEFPNVFASNLNIKTWISHETNSFVKKWRLHYRLISEDPVFCPPWLVTVSCPVMCRQGCSIQFASGSTPTFFTATSWLFFSWARQTSAAMCILWWQWLLQPKPRFLEKDYTSCMSAII